MGASVQDVVKVRGLASAMRDLAGPSVDAIIFVCAKGRITEDEAKLARFILGVMSVSQQQRDLMLERMMFVITHTENEDLEDEGPVSELEVARWHGEMIHMVGCGDIGLEKCIRERCIFVDSTKPESPYHISRKREEVLDLMCRCRANYLRSFLSPANRRRSFRCNVHPVRGQVSRRHAKLFLSAGVQALDHSVAELPAFEDHEVHREFARRCRRRQCL